MAGGQPFGRKALALPTRAHRCNRNRGIGRAEGGRARLGNAAPGGICQHRQRRHVGVLALIGGHALGRVALHMLDRAEALCRRLLHILHADIVLEIQPRPALARHRPKRGKAVGRVIGLRQIDGLWLAAQSRQRVPCRCHTRRKAAVGREAAVTGSRHMHPRHRAGGGHKSMDLRRPCRSPVHMTRKMQRWVPTARHCQTIGLYLMHAPGGADRHRLQLLAARGVADHRPA